MRLAIRDRQPVDANGGEGSELIRDSGESTARLGTPVTVRSGGTLDPELDNRFGDVGGYDDLVALES